MNTEAWSGPWLPGLFAHLLFSGPTLETCMGPGLGGPRVLCPTTSGLPAPPPVPLCRPPVASTARPTLP